ncbi:MAG: BNR/Asp-box repeat protein [Ignavibacteria bacterium]|nr:BNR/Asp-box repeat protein [Ignavibacteria bacterium]
MKKLLLLFLCIYSQLHSETWENCSNGLFRGRGQVVSMAVKDNYIFAGGGEFGDGIYRSTNYGKTWNNYNQSMFTGLGFYSFISHGGNVYASGFYGLFISTDYGENWKKKSSYFDGTLQLCGEYIYGLWGNRVYQVKNNGDSLEKKFDKYFVESLVIKEDEIYISTDSGNYISTNYGDNWIPWTKDWFPIQFYGSNILANSNNGKVYSNDNGKTWTALGNVPNLGYGELIFAINKNCIIAGAYGKGVLISYDRGKTWISKNSGLTDPWTELIYTYKDDIFIGTIAYGLFKSSNDGQSWEDLGMWRQYFYINQIAINNDKMYVCGFPTFNRVTGDTLVGLLSSSNNGENWLPLIKGKYYDFFTFKSLEFSGKNIYTVTSFRPFSNDYGIMKFTNLGHEWKEDTARNYSGVIYSGSVNTIKIDNDIIYLGTDSGVFISKDKGIRWVEKNNGLTELDVRKIAISGNNIFAGTKNGIFISKVDGTNWLKYGLDSIIINTITIFNNEIYVGSVTGVYVSYDNGESWLNQSKGLSKNESVNDIIKYENYLFAATDSGVYIWSDKAKVWEKTKLKASDVKSIVIHDNYLFAGTWESGLYRAKLSDFESLDVNNIQPSYDALSLFPNPVQNILNIQIDLPSETPIHIQIIDILGRQAAAREIPAGEKEWKLDLEGLPSGMYILKMNYKLDKILKL